MPIAIIITRG